MTSNQLGFNLSVSARKTAITLLIISAVLVALHIFWQSIMWSVASLSPFWWETAMRFNMDVEISIPTWYNQILLLAAGLIAAIIAASKIINKGEYRYYWAGVAGILAFMSMDEGASIHETFGLLDIPKHLGIDGPLFVFGWVFLGLILVATVAIIFFKFWLSLPRQTRYLLFAAAAVYVVGAIGVEMLSGYYSSIAGMDYIYNGPLVALEEGLEHFGIILAIYALLGYAERYGANLSLNFTK
jgi:hypothetical protein